MNRFEIRPLTTDPETVVRLTQILAQTVAADGSVRFMHPTPPRLA